MLFKGLCHSINLCYSISLYHLIYKELCYLIGLYMLFNKLELFNVSLCYAVDQYVIQQAYNYVIQQAYKLFDRPTSFIKPRLLKTSM